MGQGFVTTFDGKDFQYKGSCSYVFAKDCSATKKFEVKCVYIMHLFQPIGITHEC